MRQHLLSATIASLLFTGTALGGLIVEFKDIRIAPGGTGYMDVTVDTGNLPDGDLLQAYGFEFRITPADGTSTRLEFIAPPPQDFLTDTELDPPYVFAGDSFLQAHPSEPIGQVSEVVVSNDTFIGGDSTNSLNDVTVTGERLLVRLALSANTTLAPQLGDKFTVSLVPSDSSYFVDSAFNDVFSSANYGTVTMAAVPEPTVLAQLALGCMGMGAFRWCRRRMKRRKAVVEDASWVNNGTPLH